MKVIETIQEYSQSISEIIDFYLNEKVKLYPENDFGITPEIIKFIKRYTLGEKTHPRPTLVLVGYTASGNKITRDIIKTSIFTTFITKYLAIHDDIIDRDEIKNGEPTIHTQTKKFDGTDKMANDLAILAGDFLWSWAIEVILSSPYSQDRKIEAIKLISKINEFTNVGQVMDLAFVMKSLDQVQVNEVWNMYTNKVAFYCYALPLTVGAVLGGLSSKVVHQLQEYAKVVGAASQLKDDLEGVFGDEKVTGKSNLIDIRMGIKSLLIVKSFELADKGERALLKRYIGNLNVTQKQANLIREIITRVGARQYCEQMLFEKAKEANNILKKIKPHISYNSWEYLEDLIRFRLGF